MDRKHSDQREFPVHSRPKRKKLVKKMARNARSVGPAQHGSGNNAVMISSHEAIVPVTTSRTDYVEREKGMFVLIFTLALLIGLRVPPFMIRSAWMAKFLKGWGTAAFCIRTLFIVMVFAYNHLFWPSVALRYSYFFHCMIGYALVIVFHVKGREVVAAVERMLEVSANLYTKANRQRPLLFGTYMLVCLVCFVVFYALGAYFFFYLFWDIYMERLSALMPFPEGSATLYFCNWIICFGVLASYHVSSASLYVTSFICGLSYRVSSDFFESFGDRLRGDARRGPMRAHVVSRNLRHFRDLFRSIEAMDRALNAAAVAVYVAVINGAYIVLSLMLSAEARFRTREVEGICAMIGVASLLKFIFLTLSGDRIACQTALLNYDLVGTSAIVLHLSPDRSVHMFSILCANVRCLEIRVTGFNYFSITRKLFPSAFGVMVTYGTLIHQIGGYADL